MEVSIASIIIRNGKAYMPVMGKTDLGLFVDTEPVFICDLFIEEMARNLQNVKQAGHPHIQLLSPEEHKKHSNLILRATEAKSWKELAQTGLSYTIGWNDDGVLIQMSRLDKKGRWEFDPDKNRGLPLDTPLRDLIQIILWDLKSRLPT